MPRPPFMNNNHQRGVAKKKKYVYIPPPTSGAYVILVGMFKGEQNDLIRNMDKQQILNYCHRYSQSALKDNSKIWASIKGLIDKSLIGRQISRDPLYFLLDEGRDLAQKLIALAEGIQIDDESSQDTNSNMEADSQHAFSSSSQQHQSNPYEPEMVLNDGGQATFELKPGTFEIILVVDQRERLSVSCPDNSIKIEYINLACGDFIWIARPKNMHPSDRTKDLVLDYVVERKRMDDLQSSIVDGRYEQQKYRLLNSGMRRPVYLIEDFGQLRQNNMTGSSLQQAVVNMFVHSGIDVERSKSAQHTMDYLMSMTKCLQRYYLNESLRSCTQERLKQGQAGPNELLTFSEFQVVGAKITIWTVREMFAKHLIQIMGMSDKKVAVIIKKYPTISALVEGYKQCSGEKEKESLLAKMAIPDSNRTIGPVLSRRVYMAYANAVDWTGQEVCDESTSSNAFRQLGVAAH